MMSKFILMSQAYHLLEAAHTSVRKLQIYTASDMIHFFYGRKVYGVEFNTPSIEAMNGRHCGNYSVGP